MMTVADLDALPDGSRVTCRNGHEWTRVGTYLTGLRAGHGCWSYEERNQGGVVSSASLAMHAPEPTDGQEALW